MNAEEVESLLRGTRGPELPPSIERRVLAAVRRPSTPSRTLALAAAVLLAAALLVTLRSETRSPGRQEAPIKNWSLKQWEKNPATGEMEVVALVSADEARLGAPGTADLRKPLVKIYPIVNGARQEFLVQSESGRQRGTLITFEGETTIDGLPAIGVSIDMTKKVLTATFDIASRFDAYVAREARGKKVPFDPTATVAAKDATADVKTTTFDHPSIEWRCPVAEAVPAFTFRLAGVRGTSDKTSYTVSEEVRATFEDGQVLPGFEAVLTTPRHSLQLSVGY
jgi:hypothetical protein